ncbi:hypothetical protein [Clostridium akagii]|uniref:hypothetical protein n=1 Tax=Clostridium akagii TaxID=91623 RepID=UPI000AEB1DE2|nr:hypothetical protein [Clostridium akagii]
MKWNEVKPEKKEKIIVNVDKISKKILKNIGKVKPTFKSKFMFDIMRMQQME